MLKILRQSFSVGVVTEPFPPTSTPPAAFRGRPEIAFDRCMPCEPCADACPTGAISIEKDDDAEVRVVLSLADCIFCGACAAACPDAITMTHDYALAARSTDDLISRATYRRTANGTLELAHVVQAPVISTEQKTVEDVGSRLKDLVGARFGGSLHIREVDAGSCNGCEVEITALNNPLYDIERFGIHFVASPRHADMLLVTGPVTHNMEIALTQTYEATPSAKLVVATGTCAIGGGIFGKSYASRGGVNAILPVDVYIPGCPPRPEALLYGILLAIDRMPERARFRQSSQETP